MKCLVVMAHPLAQSLCSTLNQSVINQLKDQGHTVTLVDLYADQFDPKLSPKERNSYYLDTYYTDEITQQVCQLREADALVLLFPTWWFGFPAILKGWFDRVWGPSVAYDHTDDLGAIQPRLDHLKNVLAITTLGSSWWVDRLIMRQPVKRVLKTALLGTCTKGCKLRFISLYKSEDVSETRINRFRKKIAKALKHW